MRVIAVQLADAWINGLLLLVVPDEMLQPMLALSLLLSPMRMSHHEGA